MHYNTGGSADNDMFKSVPTKFTKIFFISIDATIFAGEIDNCNNHLVKFMARNFIGRI